MSSCSFLGRGTLRAHWCAAKLYLTVSILSSFATSLPRFSAEQLHCCSRRICRSAGRLGTGYCCCKLTVRCYKGAHVSNHLLMQLLTEWERIVLGHKMPVGPGCSCGAFYCNAHVFIYVFAVFSLPAALKCFLFFLFFFHIEVILNYLTTHFNAKCHNSAPPFDLRDLLDVGCSLGGVTKKIKASFSFRVAKCKQQAVALWVWCAPHDPGCNLLWDICLLVTKQERLLNYSPYPLLSACLLPLPPWPPSVLLRTIWCLQETQFLTLLSITGLRFVSA